MSNALIKANNYITTQEGGKHTFSKIRALEVLCETRNELEMAYKIIRRLDPDFSLLDEEQREFCRDIYQQR